MKRAGTTHATVVAYLALLLAVSGTAVAATGGNVRLGMFNKSDDTTVLKSSNGSALTLRTEVGVPPLRVNRDAKVARLNADRLDSLDSSDLQRRITGGCEVGSFVQSINADGSVVCSSERDITTYNRWTSARASGPFAERDAYAAAFCEKGDHVIGGGYWFPPRAGIELWVDSTVRELSDRTNDYFAAYEGHDGYEVGWTDDGESDPVTVYVNALCLREQ